jgi:predicted GNAT superfamily acetyltransferase
MGRRFLIRMEDSKDPSIYKEFEKLRNEVWGDPDDNLAGGRNLSCENYLDKGGSLFITVIEEKEEAPGEFSGLVGFSYGFAGVADKEKGYRDPDNFRFYSQYTAVRTGYQGYGLGRAIKEFQGEVVKGLFGIKAITCTYDPLVAVNAYRNIRLFGMSVVGYRAAFYANYTGFLNRLDVDCDRFTMLWDLDKPVPGPGAGYPAPSPRLIRTEIRSLRGKDGILDLPVPAGVDLGRGEETLFLEIPPDFYTMLQQTDVEEEETRSIPRRWRTASREAFLHYMERGWQVTDFFRDTSSRSPRCYYVLRLIS